MRIVLKPGEQLVVMTSCESGFLNDGEITVFFEENELRVESDLPDASGREGVIYKETFEVERFPGVDEEIVYDNSKEDRNETGV